MEHHCSTLSVDIRLGLNTWEVWRKMAPGAIIWFYLLQQTATELTSVLSAVLDVKYSLVQTVRLLTPSLLFWDTFTKNIMLAFGSSMVKLLIYFSFFFFNIGGHLFWWNKMIWNNRYFWKLDYKQTLFLLWDSRASAKSPATKKRGTRVISSQF